MPGKRTTIDDIARLAGVSKATVSRVLNHKPDVDPATRERILRLVEEQGFVPSITAAGLAGGRSRLIGCLIPSFTWPFIPEFLRAVSETIAQTSYELVLYSINDSIRERDRTLAVDRILATNLTAGLLAIFPGRSSEHLAQLYHHEFPVVVIDDQQLPTSTPWVGADLPWVGADNLTGAYEAARHLVEHGHQRIAHIQGPMQYLCSRERYQGYCQALEEAGLILDPALVVEGDFTSDGGRCAADKLFSLPPEQRPTAIFAASDQMAYGVVGAAEGHGLRIPRDVALVGFDDVAHASVVHPLFDLTTIRQPFYEMGQCAIELLLSLLNTPRYAGDNSSGWHSSLPPVSTAVGTHKETGGLIRIQLPVKLIVRSSCGEAHPVPLSIPKAAS
ncbi:MAG: LacI family DNA-binding transcriptional regulator [Chloroflexi bacterium]|nr:LacI family DNA-binding transcriptional regulator [Chloroflexota bacterium]